MIVVAQSSRRFRCFVDGVVLAEGVFWSTSGHCGGYRNFAVFRADRNLERRIDDAVAAAHKRLGLDDGEVLMVGDLAVPLPMVPL